MPWNPYTNYTKPPFKDINHTFSLNDRSTELRYLFVFPLIYDLYFSERETTFLNHEWIPVLVNLHLYRLAVTHKKIYTHAGFLDRYIRVCIIPI